MKIKSTRFKVAAVQTAPVFLDKKASVEKACQLIADSAREGAALALFPEAFISGYPDWVWLLPPSEKAAISELYTRLLANSVTVGDWSTERLCKAAGQARINVAIGVNERNSEASNASLYNTLLYISSSGTLLGKHRKLIPTGSERLMWAQGDGSTLVSFDTDIGRLGGLLCWENFMPLARTALYYQGVQVFVAPTWDSSESWQTAMRHMAREGGMFLINCAQAVRIDDIPDSFAFKKLYPPQKEWINPGNSCIVNPRGQIIAGPLNSRQEILYADIDLDEITAQKWLFDVTGHYARPDVFTFAVNDPSAPVPNKNTP